MILIAYDGSPDAQAAIARTGELMPGAPAIVLTVWQPVEQALVRAHGGVGPVAGLADAEATDAALEREARDTAEAGAGLARVAGLNATPRTRARAGSVAGAILDEAERTSAAVVAMGSRGRGALKSVLLGSVSHAVLHHAAVPVLVVPSPTAARERAERRAP